MALDTGVALIVPKEVNAVPIALVAVFTYGAPVGPAVPIVPGAVERIEPVVPLGKTLIPVGMGNGGN